MENTGERLEMESVAAQREYEVLKVSEKVSAQAALRVEREREAAEEVETAAGGVVTRKKEVVSRFNGPVGRARTMEVKGVVEKVHPLVR